MQDWTLEDLSASTGGKQIKIVQTATPGTPIHLTHATARDMAELYAVNNDTVERELTIEYGGVASPDDLIRVQLPPKQGLVLVLPGCNPLTGARTIAAFASAANVVCVQGHVKRVTTS